MTDGAFPSILAVVEEGRSRRETFVSLRGVIEPRLRAQLAGIQCGGMEHGMAEPLRIEIVSDVV